MVAPSTYPVTIYIADVDVTRYVPYTSLSFEDYARQVSSFKMTVENPSGVTPARGLAVRVEANNATIFNGYIIEINSRKRDNGITKEYELDCADMKIRLQKAVLTYNLFSGSDLDIIGSLFGSSFPDLTDLFDFDSLVNSLVDDIDFEVNDENLLDALNRLADETGAKPRFENGTNADPVPVGTISFDSGGYTNYTLANSGFTASVQSGGNPDNAYIGTATTPADGSYIEVAFNLAAVTFLENFSFDYKLDVPIAVANGDIRLEIYYDNVRILNLTPTHNSGWVRVEGSASTVTNTLVNARFAVRLVVEDLSPAAGGWTFAIDNVKVWQVVEYDVVDFDSGESYTVINTGATLNGEVASGNPGDSYSFQVVGAGKVVEIQRDLGAEMPIAGAGMHVEVDGTIGSARIRLLDEDSVEVSSETMTTVLSSVAWNYRGVGYATPVMARYIRWRIASLIGTVNVELDNLSWILSTPGNRTNLVWGDEADAADFDIDVQNSDEFAGDIELLEGDYDDFNTVVVTGGYEEVAIDWTYDADGAQDHFDLETPIKNITVSKNTGTDVTPSWTAQDVGKWGGDTFVSDGGSADVLYDAEHHWLYFDANPANLVKAFRITGTILKPIQTTVVGDTGGGPVYATTVTNKNITSVEDAISFGHAELEKRNSIKRLNFTTYHPGLKPGQAITVIDSARGLAETQIIQRISTTWLGASGHATFDIEAGEAESTGADTLIANNDKRSRETGPKTTITPQIINLYTDDSGVVMTDDSGNVLYESLTQSLYTDDSNTLLTDDSFIQLYEEVA